MHRPQGGGTGQDHHKVTDQRECRDQEPVPVPGFWDAEIGLYYLNTRYYDPETGRFINANSPALILDGEIGLSDKNLYAYCDNNPVNRKDDDGNIWQAMLVGAIVGMAGQYISDVANNISSGKKGADIFKPTSSGRDYFAAGVGGAIAAIPGGFVKTLAVGAIGNLASDGIRGNLKSTEDIVKSAGLGAFANGVGYKANDIASKLKVLINYHVLKKRII